MGSQSYRDLIVWQKSIALCKDVYKICESFPRSELYGLADQMKRAAVSIPSNIAEELKLIDRERSAQLDVSVMEVRKMLYALNNKLKSG